jgi:hypothetical protein
MEQKIVKYLKTEVDKIKKDPNGYTLRGKSAQRHVMYWSIGCGDYNNKEIMNLAGIVMSHIFATMVPNLDPKSTELAGEAKDLRDFLLKANEIFN